MNNHRERRPARTRMATSVAMFALHTLAMLLFASNNVPLAGKNADAGSMVWLVWVWIDFPLGLLFLGVPSIAFNNWDAMFCHVQF